MKTAIFVDGAFFLKRFQVIHKNNKKIDITDPNIVADEFYNMCVAHLYKENEIVSDLYRIFYYDCPPLVKKAHYPISKKSIDFGNTNTAKFKTAFLDALRKKRKLALRLGRIQDLEGWNLKKDTFKEFLSGNKKFDNLTDEDFFYDVRQKQVDIKIGVDIASVAYKKQAEQIVLIAGDADFVPAAKLARREGLDFILDPMWKSIAPDLFEHIDGLQSRCPRPKSK